jgi:hypothetical protein
MLVIMLLLTAKLQPISAIEHDGPSGRSLAINISGTGTGEAPEAAVLAVSFDGVDADFADESTSVDVRTRCDMFIYILFILRLLNMNVYAHINAHGDTDGT